MTEVKAIPTEYNGIMFRSKLEAQWAKFFDVNKIKWQYESEGYELSDGTYYLPDFYLPDQGNFFEVKGIMNDFDEHKISQLARDTNNYVIVGFANGEMEVYGNSNKITDGVLRIVFNKQHDVTKGYILFSDTRFQIPIMRVARKGEIFTYCNSYYDLTRKTNVENYKRVWNRMSRIEVVRNGNRMDFDS